MRTPWNDDYTTLGFYLDEDNNISSRLGFFHILDLMNNSSPGVIVDNISYLSLMGNPIETWSIPTEIDENTYYLGMYFTELDQMYMDRSGFKTIRKRFQERLLNANVPKTLAPIVYRITRMYSKKWLDMWQTMFYDYEPLWNYDMTEILTDEITEYAHGHVDTLANGLVVTRSGSETNTPGTTITETKSLKGFNSSNFADSDKTITAPSGNGDVTTYNNVADTHSGNDVHTHSGTDTQTKNYTLTRTGNIGVMSTTELIERQRKVVLIDYFNNVVFPDIDKALTLSVY